MNWPSRWDRKSLSRPRAKARKELGEASIASFDKLRMRAMRVRDILPDTDNTDKTATNRMNAGVEGGSGAGTMRKVRTIRPRKRNSQAASWGPRPALIDPRPRRSPEKQPDADDADKDDDPCRRLRHVVRRRRRRAFRVRLRIAGRRRRNGRRNDDPRNVERRNERRQPFRDRRRINRRRLDRRRWRALRNPPWLPRRRIVTGKPFGNGAGS